MLLSDRRPSDSSSKPANLTIPLPSALPDGPYDSAAGRLHQRPRARILVHNSTAFFGFA